MERNPPELVTHSATSGTTSRGTVVVDHIAAMLAAQLPHRAAFLPACQLQEKSKPLADLDQVRAGASVNLSPGRQQLRMSSKPSCNCAARRSSVLSLLRTSTEHDLPASLFKCAFWNGNSEQETMPAHDLRHACALAWTLNMEVVQGLCSHK